MTYASALETRYEPVKLSRPSTDKLSQLFVKLDRDLEYGLSRQLVADCLVRMELMEADKEVNTFLDASGHQYIRSKMLNSLSLKEYLEMMEKKFVTEGSKDDSAAELRHVDTFLKVIEEEKETVSARLLINTLIYLSILLFLVYGTCDGQD